MANKAKDKQAVLEELARLSSRYGSDAEFVVAGGGNTSVKIGDVLHVKPSGVTLAAIAADDFIPMDRSRLRTIFEKTYSEDVLRREEEAKADLAAARCDPSSPARPSVETPMHEAIDHAFVIHTHPNRVNGLTCGQDGAARAAEIFPEGMLWIDFIDPGHTLAMKIHTELAAYKKKHGAHPRLILLQSHGMVVGADTAEEVVAITGEVMRALEPYAPDRPFGEETGRPFVDGEPLDQLLLETAPTLRRLLSTGARRIVRFDRSPEVMELLAGARGKQIALGGTFTPDHIVYCKEKPAWVPFDPGHDDATTLADLMERAVVAFRTAEDYTPKIVLVESVGLFASDTTSGSAENAAVLFRDWIRVARNTQPFGGPRFLSARDVAFIDNWEVEAYRRKKAKESPAADRRNPLGLDPNWSRELDGRVVLVTGAAAGVGRTVAQACLFMGASVVRVDRAPEALADERNALTCTADITKEDEIRAAFAAAVREYGGVDAVVNAPSLSPDGPLDELDIPAYEQALRVNLLGYAIVGKYAAKVMKSQGWGVGLSLTSKSGLFPSAENNAYAATKGGEINQGHSFAAELGPFGIRWNNLALGNVFEVGSELWNDEHMAVRAAKKGIEYADMAECRRKVREYYNALNALRTEVTAQDIAYAVGFMLSDKSRVMSGHTMLLDGGQTYH